MKELKQITSYELFMFTSYEEWDIEYIQFDEHIKWHQIGEIKTFREHYEDWNNFNRGNTIFTALIKWFDIHPEKHMIIICLKGNDGELHYEKE